MVISKPKCKASRRKGDILTPASRRRCLTFQGNYAIEEKELKQRLVETPTFSFAFPRGWVKGSLSTRSFSNNRPTLKPRKDSENPTATQFLIKHQWWAALFSGTIVGGWGERRCRRGSPPPLAGHHFWLLFTEGFSFHILWIGGKKICVIFAVSVTLCLDSFRTSNLQIWHQHTWIIDTIK